jgi:hypothetical protein
MSPYGPDGVDVTLIRWMLSLEPEERLQVLQGFVDDWWEVRGRSAEEQLSLDSADPR